MPDIMVMLEEKTYEALKQTNASQAQQIVDLKAELQWLREQLGLAKRRLHAPSSEQTPAGQKSLLFNEAEVTALPGAPEPSTETITYSRRKKNAGQRELQLEGLPVEEIEYRLPQEEQFCPQCAGKLHEMGSEVSQEVKFIPASLRLVHHIRYKYTCRHCQKEEIATPVLTAKMPVRAFPNSLASPSAVAYIMCEKFVDGSPLYRQEQSLKRLGFELSRQTMANWMIAGADWLAKIYKRLHHHLLKEQVLFADETTVQVLHEPGRAAQTTSTMWLYRSGRDGPPIILFEYQTTRSGEHPRTFLADFVGYLHVDGYAGYDRLPGVKLSGCWAHVRRKFLDALSTLPKEVRERGEGSACRGLAFCERLFAIEGDLSDCTPQERLAGRQARSQRVVEQMYAWLVEQSGFVAPKSALGQAINYPLGQWGKLVMFLTDGRLEISNNRSERAIKPFVIGRKNWLFANTPRGATASAVTYSIVETAKENDLDPFTYLTYLFEQLPNIDTKSEQALDLLLPWSELVQTRFRVPSTASR